MGCEFGSVASSVADANGLGGCFGRRRIHKVGPHLFLQLGHLGLVRQHVERRLQDCWVERVELRGDRCDPPVVLHRRRDVLRRGVGRGVRTGGRRAVRRGVKKGAVKGAGRGVRGVQSR